MKIDLKYPQKSGVEKIIFHLIVNWVLILLIMESTAYFRFYQHNISGFLGNELELKWPDLSLFTLRLNFPPKLIWWYYRSVKYFYWLVDASHLFIKWKISLKPSDIGQNTCSHLIPISCVQSKHVKWLYLPNQASCANQNYWNKAEDFFFFLRKGLCLFRHLKLHELPLVHPLSLYPMWLLRSTQV